MTIYGHIIRTLLHDRWMNAAIGFGIMLSTAVLTGALLIGDSMRGSLKTLTLDRLGRIDMVLTGERFFEASAFDDLIDPKQGPWTEAATAILLPAAARTGEDDTTRTSGCTLLGVDDTTWNLFGASSFPPSAWERDEIAINRELADRLGVVNEGSSVSIRISKPESIPRESSLGKRNDTLIRARLKVRTILPNEGIGRFSLSASQKAGPLAIIPLAWLHAENRLDNPGKVNTVFMASDSPLVRSTETERNAFAERYEPNLSVLGVHVDSFGEYFTHVKSDRMIFTPPQAAAIREKLPENGTFPVIVYLADSIRSVKDANRETPYSTVAGSDYLQLADDEIAINRWTADDLGAEVGDSIALTFMSPESVHGKTVTKTETFKLKSILDPSSEPFAADRLLTPEMKGISDSKSLSEWDPPFPFDAKRIREKDEKYWDEFKTTPKAFVSLKTGQKLWGSRFGDVTTFVVEGKNSPGLKLLDPAIFGASFQPVKELGLKASAGTTPFQVLFLAFGCFIIGSALMLVAMLSRLGIERKAKRIGTMLALGWGQGKLSMVHALEGGTVALLGSLLGIPCGIAYAALMLHGLRTWWIDAVSVPFLSLHIEPSSLLVGFFSGWCLSIAVILFSVRSAVLTPAWRLLAGQFGRESE